jgi:glyoxylase-like metal-dependent hydrolase (beta-lactamase superfamily II)
VAAYDVQLIKVGEADVRGPEAFWMARWDEWVTLFFYVVAIRGDGRTILVNTGPPDDRADLDRVWREYLGDERGVMRVAPAERLTAALAAHDIDPAQVDTVVISPLQAYATGNLDRFPRAEIALSRTGWAEFAVPRAGTNPTSERATRIPPPLLARLVTDWWPRVRLLEDEDELAPGLRVFRSGVHDRGSLALVIDTARGTVVWSDSAYLRGNVERRHPLGIAYDLDEARRSYDRIAGEADLFLPGFEPALMREHPGGHVA